MKHFKNSFFLLSLWMMLHDNIVTSSLNAILFAVAPIEHQGVQQHLDVCVAFLLWNLRCFTGIFFLNLTSL